MRLPPNLADTALRALVESDYAVPVAALTFLPIGNDVSSFVYRVDAPGGERFLLKLRAVAGFSAASLAIPRFLSEQGIPHIVAPLLAADGSLWVAAGDYVASLAPFVDARTATDAGLSLAQWQELGATLRQIHGCALPPEHAAMVGHERFVPSRRAVLDEVAPVMAGSALPDPVQEQLRRFWGARQELISRVVARADALGAQLSQSPPPAVLCHADFHTWNILVQPDGQLWIVDWDETVVAPKERDLMFAVGGIGSGLVSAEESAAFLAGYGGDAAIDPLALAYYRYAWAAQELGSYSEQICLRPELPADVRQDELRYLMLQFEPGNIVDLALASDTAGR